MTDMPDIFILSGWPPGGAWELDTKEAPITGTVTNNQLSIFNY
jgi:hypothetical protein